MSQMRPIRKVLDFTHRTFAALTSEFTERAVIVLRSGYQCGTRNTIQQTFFGYIDGGECTKTADLILRKQRAYAIFCVPHVARRCFSFACKGDRSRDVDCADVHCKMRQSIATPRIDESTSSGPLERISGRIVGNCSFRWASGSHFRWYFRYRIFIASIKRLIRRDGAMQPGYFQH